MFIWLDKSFLPLKKWSNSRARFRSSDLWVMGPARFHCATLLHIPQSQKAIHKSRRIMSVLEERILIKESEMNRCSGKLKSQRLTKGMPNKFQFRLNYHLIAHYKYNTVFWCSTVNWLCTLFAAIRCNRLKRNKKQNKGTCTVLIRTNDKIFTGAIFFIRFLFWYFSEP